MKHRKLLGVVTVLLAAVLLILVACTASPPEPTPPGEGVAAASTIVVSRVSPTNTPLPATQTPESATVVPTEVIPSPTPAPPTAVPVTLTPLPTLAAEELEAAIAELFANPMNCDVPCWWGAVPNETTVFEVQQFLTPYHFIVHKRYNNEILDLLEVWVRYDEGVNQFDFRVFYLFNGIVLKDIFAEQSLPLYDMLIRFGRPDQIWLETMSFKLETLPFRLNMVYLQEGMAVGYVVDGDIQGEMVIGCFAAEESGNLSLIVPNTATSYRDFPTIFEVDRRYLLLEEATGLTMEDFMERFLDPTQPQCVETAAALWE